MESKNYDNIIEIEYPFKLKRGRMDMSNRAAQFSGFKALSEYDSEIAEAARLTEKKIELDDSAKDFLNIRLQIIKERISNSEYPLVNIVYFIPDEEKAGGKYVDLIIRINEVDEYTKSIRTTQGLIIPIEDVYRLEGKLFE